MDNVWDVWIRQQSMIPFKLEILWFTFFLMFYVLYLYYIRMSVSCWSHFQSNTSVIFYMQNDYKEYQALKRKLIEYISLLIYPDLKAQTSLIFLTLVLMIKYHNLLLQFQPYFLTSSNGETNWNQPRRLLSDNMEFMWHLFNGT